MVAQGLGPKWPWFCLRLCQRDLAETMYGNSYMVASYVYVAITTIFVTQYNIIL